MSRCLNWLSTTFFVNYFSGPFIHAFSSQLKRFIYYFYLIILTIYPLLLANTFNSFTASYFNVLISLT